MTAPQTHYELFRGLREEGVEFLVAGATALTLHGVPRLTYDLDLLVPPDASNVARLRALLSRWGYEPPPAPGSEEDAGIAVERWRHRSAPLAEIDLARPGEARYGELRGRAETFTLVDTPVPTIGSADLGRTLAQRGRPEDREDLAGLRILEAILRGEEGPADDPRWVQARKFQRWHTENRCEWLLAANRLRAGLPPDVAPPRDPRLRSKSPWRR